MADPTPIPDALVALDTEYAEIIGLLDRSAVVSRLVATVPNLAGVDMAWVGEPDGADGIVLGKSVNTLSRLVEGLVVPVGVGLGGRVLAARRALWVSNYLTSGDITHHFRRLATIEEMLASEKLILFGASLETSRSPKLKMTPSPVSVNV